MKALISSAAVVSLTLLAGTSSTQAQTLDVGTSRTPTLTDVPTINLPNQHDNTIGQAFSTNEQTAELPPSDTVSVSEPLSPPKIPTTEITRGADGITISTTKDGNAVEKTPARNQEQSKYIVGMSLTGTAKVFDGHSFLLGDHPVRLNGVDAPGLKQVCTAIGGATWRCGEAARAFLKGLINGKRLTCHVDGLAGAGAAVSCSGAGIPDVTRLVVDAGMAVVNSHGRKHRDNQAMAQRDKTGLWVGKFSSPSEWRRNNP